MVIVVSIVSMVTVVYMVFMIAIGDMDNPCIRSIITFVRERQTDEKRNIEVQTDKQTDRLWIWVDGGWMDGWKPKLV